MDRQLLDKLYLGSRGNPHRAFDRALSESLMGPEAYAFLVEHLDELDLSRLVKFFNSPLRHDVEFVERPFVRHLQRLARSMRDWDVLEVVKVAPKISPAAWIEDLTIPLKGQLPNHVWYRLVDEARGGELFNALNTGMAAANKYVGNWDPTKTVWPEFEQERPVPLVAEVLDRAHDDLAMAEFALKTLPLIELLGLHERFPRLITLHAIKKVAQDRVRSTSESWVPPEGGPRLHEWMAPLVAERLKHCEDPVEAKFLWGWLFDLPPESHKADPYELAIARFKLAVQDPAKHELFRSHADWTTIIGRHLNSGSSWKTRGRDFVALCLDLGKGFPINVVNVALESATGDDGASPDDHRRAILRKVHDVTAKLLVERAEIAIKAGDFDKGDLFLSAFMSLDPGSFIRGALHRLRVMPGLPSDLVLRIEGCEELARAGGRDPSVDAINDVFLVLLGHKS